MKDNISIKDDAEQFKEVEESRISRLFEQMTGKEGEIDMSTIISHFNTWLESENANIESDDSYWKNKIFGKKGSSDI